MAFRNDQDALLARADALQNQLDAARKELADSESESEDMAAKIAELEQRAAAAEKRAAKLETRHRKRTAASSNSPAAANKRAAIILVSITVTLGFAGVLVAFLLLSSSNQPETATATPAVTRAAEPIPKARPARGRLAPDAIYSVPVRDDNPSVGAGPEALITIVEASDFSCKYCAKVRETIAHIMDAYSNKVRFVYKHLIIQPRRATDAALAACAANLQGQWAPMTRQIWADTSDLSAATMDRYAAELALDKPRFDRDRQTTCREVIERDQAELAELGVKGAPTFFINGRFLSGAQPFSAFKPVIEEELAKARAAIDRGEVTAQNYYQTMVVDRGKKHP